jgi:hypothetical protein
MFRTKKSVYRSGNPYVIQWNFLEDRQAEILRITSTFAALAPGNLTDIARNTAITALSQVEQKIIDFFIEFENLL